MDVVEIGDVVTISLFTENQRMHTLDGVVIGIDGYYCLVLSGNNKYRMVLGDVVKKVVFAEVVEEPEVDEIPAQRKWRKLSDLQVIEMRAMHAAGAKVVELAERYRISRRHASDIVHRRDWLSV